MISQPELSDSPPPPRPKYRLFLGTFPDADAVRSICVLQNELRDRFALTGKFRPSHILHVTLHHLGDHAERPERIIQKVREACPAALERQASFDVTFDRIRSFPGRPGNLPLVLVKPDGNAELMKLHRRLITALAAHRLAAPRDLQFVPHVTLLYDRLSVPEHPAPPIGWRLREIRLILSHLGQTRYEPVQTWTLHR
jgi:2'-5' RNA ligase